MFLKSIKRCCKIWGSLSRKSPKMYFVVWSEVVHCQETIQEFKCFHWIKLKAKALKKITNSLVLDSVSSNNYIMCSLFFLSSTVANKISWVEVTSHLMLNIYVVQVISDNSAVIQIPRWLDPNLIFPSLSIKFTVLLPLLIWSPVALTQISLATKLKVISLSLRVIFFTNILSITQTSSVKVLNGRS